MHGDAVGRRMDELSRAIGMPIVLRSLSGSTDEKDGPTDTAGAELLKGRSA
jgi:hypothetical protein